MEVVVDMMNGKLSSIGNYSYSEIGEWKEYYENGKLKSIGKYGDYGKRIGKWKHYKENGKLDETYNYDKN